MRFAFISPSRGIAYPSLDEDEEATEDKLPDDKPPRPEDSPPEHMTCMKCDHLAVGWGYMKFADNWEWGPACGEHET